MKKLVWIVGGLGLIAASWLVGPALAAGLANNTQTLAADAAAIPRCDTDGVSTVFNLSSTNVASVTVSNIGSGCGGGVLKVTVNNQLTTQSGTGVVLAGGGVLTVPLGAPIAVKDVMQTEISVT
jgi:pantothenate kinase type III